MVTVSSSKLEIMTSVYFINCRYRRSFTRESKCHFGHNHVEISKDIISILSNKPLSRGQNFSYVQIESICKQQIKCYSKHLICLL